MFVGLMDTEKFLVAGSFKKEITDVLQNVVLEKEVVNG